MINRRSVIVCGAVAIGSASVCVAVAPPESYDGCDPDFHNTHWSLYHNNFDYRDRSREAAFTFSGVDRLDRPMAETIHYTVSPENSIWRTDVPPYRNYKRIDMVEHHVRADTSDWDGTMLTIARRLEDHAIPRWIG